MPVHYAYAADVSPLKTDLIHVEVNIKQMTGPDGYRYLLTFASQEVSNQWWRAIQDQAARGTKGYKDVQRISSQSYRFSTVTFGAFHTAVYPDMPLARFAGIVVYTWLPDTGSGDRPRLWPLPPPPERDVIPNNRQVFNPLLQGVSGPRRATSTSFVIKTNQVYTVTIFAPRRSLISIWLKAQTQLRLRFWHPSMRERGFALNSKTGMAMARQKHSIPWS